MYNPELVKQELTKLGIFTEEQFLEALRNQEPVDIGIFTERPVKECANESA